MYLIQGHRGGWAHPSCHWSEGGVHLDRWPNHHRVKSRSCLTEIENICQEAEISSWRKHTSLTFLLLMGKHNRNVKWSKLLFLRGERPELHAKIKINKNKQTFWFCKYEQKVIVSCFLFLLFQTSRRLNSWPGSSVCLLDCLKKTINGSAFKLYWQFSFWITFGVDPDPEPGIFGVLYPTPLGQWTKLHISHHPSKENLGGNSLMLSRKFHKVTRARARCPSGSRGSNHG